MDVPSSSVSMQILMCVPLIGIFALLIRMLNPFFLHWQFFLTTTLGWHISPNEVFCPSSTRVHFDAQMPLISNKI
jgi:hypothetical protein